MLHAALDGGARRGVAATSASAGDFGRALERVREGMRSHVFDMGRGRLSLSSLVHDADRLARADGLHVLHDWDGKADRINADVIPVDALGFLYDRRGDDPVDEVVLAILLDYYFLYVLALLSMRVWDGGAPDRDLDRLDELVRALQGPDGSGQPFVAGAGTLLLLAGSHFEVEGRGYDVLLARVRTLNAVHRTSIALTHAAALGSHLRFGFEATYAHDVGAMRDDNAADYPWLCFSIATLLKAYATQVDAGATGLDRDRLVDALLGGLSADVDAFIGTRPPAVLESCADDWTVCRDLLVRHRQSLLSDLERHQPRDATFSPLSLFFNFSQNVLKGIVIDALLWGEPRRVALDDVLTGLPTGVDEPLRLTMAKTLMAYARTHPDRIRGKLMPVIVYDPQTGRRTFGGVMRRLGGQGAPPR